MCGLFRMKRCLEAVSIPQGVSTDNDRSRDHQVGRSLASTQAARILKVPVSPCEVERCGLHGDARVYEIEHLRIAASYSYTFFHESLGNPEKPPFLRILARSFSGVGGAPRFMASVF